MGAESERLLRMEALFHIALEMPADDCEAYLQRECLDDQTLHAEVLQLLAAERKIEGFVAEPITDTRPFDAFDAEAETEDPWVGRRIGAFEVKGRIGRGGMGVVYRGERQGEFVQTAAIKLMSFDMQAPFAEERFLRERDALASLEHRNIVRLIDGGVTEDGFPYLAMEFIGGRRIDEVCDGAATEVKQILMLFLQVCEAVSYVHRNLLLHRDLKPANVMVAEDGHVKLLDFGTFKSLTQTDASLTQPGMQALTVRYASPEQLEAQPASTVSDVFSLGMMLYRLLLGELPGLWDDLTIGRYLDALAAEDSGPIAAPLQKQRRVNSQLAGDLEAIVRKALRFRAEDRYQDVDAFADDLRAALENRPIRAVRIGRMDEARRFLRRNRSTVMLTACTVFLCAFGVALLVQGGKSLRAEQLRAERGLNDEATLAHFLLVDYFEQLKGIPESTDAQRQAISQALAYVDKLPNVGSAAQFQVDRVQAYTEMGSLLGNPYENNLGDTTGAVRELEKAVALGHDLVAAHPDNRRFRQLNGDANMALGRVYFGTGKPQNAERYLIAGAAENRTLVAQSRDMDGPGMAAAAAAVDALGDLYGLDGAATLRRPVDAERAYKEAQALDARGLAMDPTCSRCRRGVALEFWKIGMLKQDPRESAASFEAGIQTLSVFSSAEQATARVQRTRILIQQKLGIAYLALDRVHDGLHMLDEVRRGLQKTAAADPTDSRAHYDLFALDFNIAEFLDVTGPFENALTVDEELLHEAEILERLDPDNSLLKEHTVEAKLRLGLIETHHASAARGATLEQEAEEVLNVMAHGENPSPELLQAAADAEIAVRGDGVFAVNCALKAIAASPEPSSNQYATLAQAQLLAGSLAGAQLAATTVLRSAGKRGDAATRVQDVLAAAILHASTVDEAIRISAVSKADRLLRR